MKTDYNTKAFKSPAEWREWLSEHHADTDGLWIKIYKIASGVKTITIGGALDEALCYGWIDGQSKSNDELSYLQKFTPRRKASLWSKRNIDNIQRLTDAGRMMPAGLAEVERAQTDGRWADAYDAPSTMVTPADFLSELESRPKAKAFFETLSKSSKYSIGWQLQTAKTEETRLRRKSKLLAKLEAGEQP